MVRANTSTRELTARLSAPIMDGHGTTKRAPDYTGAATKADRRPATRGAQSTAKTRQVPYREAYLRRPDRVRVRGRRHDPRSERGTQNSARELDERSFLSRFQARGATGAPARA